MANGSQQTSEPSLVTLLGGIENDAKDLLVQEVALIKLEVQDELRKAKSAAFTLGIGIGVVAGGGVLLMLMLVHLLVVFTEIPLWGCYGVVGSSLVVLGGVWLAVGKATAADLAVAPRPTVKTQKENGQWLTEQTTSNRR